MGNVRFSNRPVWVKRFQTIHRYRVDVAHGLVLLFGIGTRALPSWDSRTRWNDLWGGLGRVVFVASLFKVSYANASLDDLQSAYLKFVDELLA
jgi:hypothetical protein